jgi:predicted TIM-barrel fold metal-dependent hydrolase
MQEFINVHCHLLNFKFIPDAFFRTRTFFLREWLLRQKTTRWFARILFFFVPGKKHDRYHESLAMMDKDIDAVTERFVAEMAKAEIVLATPLMMDLELASFRVKPEAPYRYQVVLISEIAARHPGEIMPFIMFDPRRKGASELIKKALEEMGFLGVKVYPPLGHHPDPLSFLNEAEVNHELAEIYEYCEKESIPVTTHCSAGGAYSGDLMRCRELAQEFAHPSSWRIVLEKYPKLHLNLAHFGGNEDFMRIDDPESWSAKILELMKKYDNVYADISYHEPALLEESAGTYFKILEKLMNTNRVKDRIIFGTDWPMTRHTWTEEDYVGAFKGFPPKMLQKIAFENPLNFLFPDGKLPPRIESFFRSKRIKTPTLPQWMRKNLHI